MSKIVVDESLSSKLSEFNTEIELCDAAGRTLGHYFPQEAYQKLLYSQLDCPFTDQEIEQHINEPGGKTLTEILQRLGQE